MRKFIFAICAVIGFMPVSGFAGFSLGPSGACAVDDDGWEEFFWYCGNQESGCDNETDRSRDHRIWLVQSNTVDYPGYNWSEEHPANGDPSKTNDWAANAFSWEGHKYACCGGSKTSSGRLQSYSNWEQTATKNFDNSGQCSYKVTPCGVPIEPECFFPDTCTDKTKKLRVLYIDNNENNAFDSRCVEPCTFPNAFESIFSDACVDCPTTRSSGIDSQGVCITCNTDEFFVMPTSGCLGRGGGRFSDGNGTEHTFAGCCVKKNKQEIASKSTFKECFRCVLQPSTWLACMRGQLGNTAEGLSACGLKQEIDAAYRTQKATN